MKKYINLLSIFSLLFIVGCDREDFAEINSNPSEIASPDLRFQITKTVSQMYNNDYTVWFYSNFDYVYPWSQISTSGNGANSEEVVEMGPSGGQGLYPTFYANIRDVRAQIDALPEDEKSSMRAMRAMTFPILIQTAIAITDQSGSMVYNEGALAAYTSPPLITPVYDNQELLFNTWLDELDAAIPELLVADQLSLGNQDIIYEGDYVKWAKFCNLLKLKIAARLVNKDRARALQIASEVANSPAGYMDGITDDFIYGRGVQYRGTGNGQQPGIGGENLVNFMIENKDPRVGVLFEKNDFNGEIVQAFIDAGKALPPYVDQYVELDLDGDFSGWSGPGEPWVRFHGVPLSPDAAFAAENDIYFKQNELNRITVGSDEKNLYFNI